MERPILFTGPMVRAILDALIAFWDGKSRGTADMVAKMRAKGKPARTYDRFGNRTANG